LRSTYLDSYNQKLLQLQNVCCPISRLNGYNLNKHTHTKSWKPQNEEVIVHLHANGVGQVMISEQTNPSTCRLYQTGRYNQKE